MRIVYECDSIIEIKNQEMEVVGYRVTKFSEYPDDHDHCDYFIGKVQKFKDHKSRRKSIVSTGRSDITNVVKSGDTVISFEHESFSPDGVTKDITKYTTESEIV